MRVFRAQLGLICVRQMQVWPCLSVKDIDEQCEFPQFNSRSDGFDAIFRQINLRYQWAIWVSATLTLDFDMTSQQMSLIKAPIFPLQNSAPTLLRVFIRPPAKFRQSHAYFSAIPWSPVVEKSRFFLLRRNNPAYTRRPLGCLLEFWPSKPKPCGGKKKWGLQD